MKCSMGPLWIAVVVGTALSCVPAWAAPQIINAKITKVDPDARTVDIQLKDQLFSTTMSVDPTATLVLGNSRAELADFKPGMQVALIADIRQKKITRISGQGAPSEGRPTRKPSPKSSPSGKPAENIEARGELPESLKSLDDIVQSFLAEQEVRGAAVVIVKDGKGVFARGYGFADKSKKTPAEPSTLFPVDGVSKLFTATTLAQLASQGKVDPAAPFFDALGTKPTASEDDVPDNSRFVDAATIDLIKNPNRFRRDSFFKEYAEDSDFRKKLNDRIKTMPDGGKIDLRKQVKYDSDDLQYLLLARLVAKATGKSYEEGVKELLLAPMGITAAKVILLPLEKDDDDRSNPAPATNERSREKRIQKKKDEEKEKLKKKQDLYAGVAQVQFQAGKDFELPSMSMDGAGSWVVSPLDLARFARTVAATGEGAFVKPESAPLLWGPPAYSAGADDASDDDDDKKDEKKPTREAKIKSPTYFSAGWTVTRPASEDPAALLATRRSVHSGPIGMVSEGSLHIVVALTTVYPSNKAGADHPLIVELLDATTRVKEWPKGDALGPSPLDPAPEVASTPGAPAEGGEMPEKRSMPRVPVVLGVADQLESTVSECLSAYDQFLAAGGRKLLREVHLSAAPDFQRIAQRVPDGTAAADALVARFNAEILLKLISIKAAVTTESPAQNAAADAVSSYGQSVASFVSHLAGILKGGGSPEDARQKLKDHLRNEEMMYTNLVSCLEKIDAAFPSEPKAASSETEFQRSIKRLALRLRALDQKLQASLSARFAQIESIQAKAGGATAEEQANLPILIKEAQTGASDAVLAFGKYIELATKSLEQEKAAGSNYVGVWQAMLDLANAQSAYAQYMAAFGTEKFKPEDDESMLGKVEQARQALADAQAALAAPPANAAAPAGEAPPADPNAAPSAPPQANTDSQ